MVVIVNNLLINLFPAVVLYGNTDDLQKNLKNFPKNPDSGLAFWKNRIIRGPEEAAVP
jgi:hypothetical protein